MAVRNGMLLLLVLFAAFETAIADDVLLAASERFANDKETTPPDLRRHVLPLMGRLGCNGRACHGSFQGQGGFKLSLFGYDLKADHESLLGGDTPRVNCQDPPQSLILQKPTMQVDHEGGERMKPEGWEYRLLAKWIEAGAQPTENKDIELALLEVNPPQLRFNKPGDKANLTVTAHWSDGSREDVTPLCRFRSNDEAIAVIDEQGEVTSVHVGDTHVVAFYDNGVQPVEVITPFNSNTGDKYPTQETPTKIDELVINKLRLLGIVPSMICNDAEFLRRVSLDITGTLPTPDEVCEFLADTRADKRELKVDQLLETRSYAAWWTTRLCDYTGNNPELLNEQPFIGVRASAQWYNWIYDRVTRNVPYDELMAGIILGQSRSRETEYKDYCSQMDQVLIDESCQGIVGAETLPYYWMRRNNRKSEDMAQAFAHAFLGIRIQCAQCHKHPFDQWTKQDYEDFTVFFRRVRFGISPEDKKQYDEISNYLKAPDLDVNLGRDAAKLIAEEVPLPWREVFIQPPRPLPKNPGKPKKNQTRPGELARFLDGRHVDVSQVDDPRTLLAEWVREDAERYFARAFVNRVWANYFHRGIVEPADDFNRANPPSNAPLLDYLTQEFVARKFDMKWLHREIVLSRTYQLSCVPNETNALDNRNFSRAVPRRLPAEVAYNAIILVTANTQDLSSLREQPDQLMTGSGFSPANKNRARANYALSVFGRPTRLTTCDCERTSEPTLLQTLFLQNDNEMLGMIERPEGWLKEIVDGRRKSDMNRQLSELTIKVMSKESDLCVLREQMAVEQSTEKESIRKGLRQRAVAIENELRNLRKQQVRLEGEIKKISYPASSIENEKVVRQAYLRSLCRLPKPEETQSAMDYLAETKDARAGIRDLIWALVNTKEFILNH